MTSRVFCLAVLIFVGAACQSETPSGLEPSAKPTQTRAPTPKSADADSPATTAASAPATLTPADSARDSGEAQTGMTTPISTGGTSETRGPTETGAASVVNPDLRLVNLGGAIVDALKTNDVAAIVALTPLGTADAAAQCPNAPAGVESKLEVEARARHCARSIPWDEVTDVRAAGATATGPAEGCREGTESFDRFRMLVVAGESRWEIDLLGTVGRDGKPNAFSGAITCKPRS